MIIVKFCGGLGNQMYQFAMLIALQKKYPKQEIKADISHYMLFEEHNGFELSSYFGIKLNYALYLEVKKVYSGLVPNRSYLFLPWKVRDFIVHQFQWKYNSICAKLHPNVAKWTVTEHNWKENKELLSSGDWYINGMWQNTEYFQEYQKDIISAFNMNPKLSETDSEDVRILKSGEVIAVHVRGGDFLNGKTFNLCGKKYYNKALSKFAEKKPLYIFTDDSAYAQELLCDYKIAGIVSHSIDESIKDMFMMSLAKNLVISNSTFSFWSAFLNMNADKIICPRYATKNVEGYTNACFKSDWDIIDNLSE